MIVLLSYFIFFPLTLNILFKQKVFRIIRVDKILVILLLPLISVFYFILIRLRSHRHIKLCKKVIQNAVSCGNNFSPTPSCFPIVPFTYYEVFENENYLKDILEAISKAKINIIIMQFLFSGVSGSCVLDALDEAYQRGIKVYLILDQIIVMHHGWNKKFFKRLCDTPFVTFYNPSLWNLFKYNQRGHSKFVCIDEKFVWIGSHNIRDLANRPDDEKFVENVTVRVESERLAYHVYNYACQIMLYTGSTLLSQDQSFQKDMPQQNLLKENNMRRIQLSYSVVNPDKDSFLLHYVDMILRAKKKCIIVTPYFYFYPMTNVINIALRILLRRGVAVEILAPIRDNSQWLCTVYTNLSLSYMCFLGAKIYRGKFDHTKILIIDDDTVVIGSQNVDPRSLCMNLEINQTIYDREVQADIFKIYERKRANAKLWNVPKLPLLQRIYSHIIFLLIKFY